MSSSDDERLRSAISTKIDELEREYARPGWTLWALMAGLATCVWLFLSMVQQFTGSWNLVARFFFTLYVLGRIALSSLPGSVSRFNQSTRLHVKFSNAYYRSAKRVIITEVLLVALAFVAFDNISVPHWIRILGLVWLISYALLLTVGLSFAFFRYPLVVTGQRMPPKGVPFVIVLFVVLPTVVAIGASLQFIGVVPQALTELRLSALLAAIAFIFLSLIDKSKPDLLIAALKDLRSDLTFGDVDQKEAENRLEIIVLGFQLQQALDQELSAVLSGVHRMTELNERVGSHIDLLHRVQTENEVTTHRSTVQTVHDAISHCISEETSLIGKLDRDVSTLNMKLLLIARQCRNPLEVVQLSNTVRAEVNTMQESFVVMKDKILQLVNQPSLFPDDQTSTFQ